MQTKNILVTARVWDWWFLNDIAVAWCISSIAVLSSIAIPRTGVSVNSSHRQLVTYDELTQAIIGMSDELSMEHILLSLTCCDDLTAHY